MLNCLIYEYLDHEGTSRKQDKGDGEEGNDLGSLKAGVSSLLRRRESSSLFEEKKQQTKNTYRN